jgi:hypothetical protein
MRALVVLDSGFFRKKAALSAHFRSLERARILETMTKISEAEQKSFEDDAPRSGTHGWNAVR